MKQFEVHSEHNPETWLKLWDRRVVEYNSKNKSAYSGTKCFFGTHKDNQLMVFFHKDYDTVYLATRFMGTIEPDGTGSRISGVIGKMRSANIFLWFMFFAMGFGGIAALTQQLFQQAIALFALALIGLACVLTTPADSAARLERLLKVLSFEDELDEEAESAAEAVETAEKSANDIKKDDTEDADEAGEGVEE